MAEIVDLEEAIARHDLAALGRVAARRRPWAVLVDDNFHHMDESERATHGRFATLEEALAACRAIVDEDLARLAAANPGAGGPALFDLYAQFGADPWVAGSTWSAWDYARERCLRAR